MHIAIDVPATTPLDAALVGTPNTLHLMKTLTIQNVDTLCMDGIVSVPPGVTIDISLSTNFATAANNLNLQQPYWSGFRIDSLFSPLVIFSASRNIPLNPPTTALTFNKVINIMMIIIIKITVT